MYVVRIQQVEAFVQLGNTGDGLALCVILHSVGGMVFELSEVNDDICYISVWFGICNSSGVNSACWRFLNAYLMLD